MTDFERDLVNALNRYFESDEHPHPSGFSARDQQSQFVEQVTDVMVWKPDLFIECKSIKTSSAGGVGFRSHFNTGDDEEDQHQIERETEIINRAGVKGALALELKRGRGKSRKAFLIDWSFVVRRFRDEEAMNSIRFHELEDLCETEDWHEVPPAYELEREGGEWVIDHDVFEWMQKIHG